MRKIVFIMVVIVGILFSMSITAFADVQISDINSGWYWPTLSSIRTITSEFGRARPETNYPDKVHQAIDIAASEGNPVYATRAGDVVETSDSCKGSHNSGQCSCSAGKYYGNYVVIYHGVWNGHKIYSMYMHLKSVGVNVGTSVKDRQEIGKIGNTGPSTGAHLHFQISKGSKNPSHNSMTQAENNFINTNPDEVMFTSGIFSHNRIGTNAYPNSKYGDIIYIMDGVDVTPPDTEAPTSVGMICNYENMTINPGTQIQLDFWYSNGDSFDIVIDKDGSEYQQFNNVTSPFYYTPTERGSYIARGYAKNSVGSTESNRRAFYVKYVNTPTSVGMICNYENMTVKPGTQMQFDFWYTNGDSFDIIIDRNGVEYQRFNNVGSPFYYTPTEEGNYLARGYAKNEAGSTESNRRAFYVSYSEPPTNVGMVCNYENMSVKTGTAIEFSYWYHNGNSFDVIIYRNNVEYERFSNVSNPFYYVPSEEGNYLAVGYAKNSAGATESNRRAFNVLSYVPPIPNGTYSILSSLDNSYALNVYARDTGDNNTLIIWQDPSQKFDVTYIGGGLYKIISSVTGKALCARDSGMSSGTDLVQYTWNGSLNQKWKIEVADDGYFYIVNCLNGLYVDVDNSNASNGTNVWLYDGNSSYAQKWLFTPLTYTISYNANGGENAPAAQTKNHRQNLTLSNITPSKTGCDFLGWSENPNTQNASYSKGATFTGNYNTTLYAVWKPKQYYLDVNGLLDNNSCSNISGYGTFDLYLNGILVGDDINDAYQLCDYGTSYTITDINNSLGRSYNGSNIELSGTITNTTNIELQFITDQYMIAFDANGGTTSTPNKTVVYDSTYGALPVPNRMGYTFKGWYTEADGGTEITDSTKVTITSEQTLYAHWQINDYTLTYNLNGGEGDISEVICNYGTDIVITDAEPERDGYMFLGWSVDAEASEAQYRANDTYRINQDTVLYAVWMPVPKIVAEVNKYSSYAMCNVRIDNIDSDCMIIIAKYKGNKLVSTELRKYDGEEEIFPVFEDIDTVKIIAVENIEGLKPICKPASLNIG